MNRGNYENFLIREVNPQVPESAWCSQCERHVEDCVCEELCEWFNETSSYGTGFEASDPRWSRDGSNFRETVGSAGDGDSVCFPALSPVPLQLDYPVWRMSFSEYGEHMGWEVPA
jgi:hypothetical protein